MSLKREGFGWRTVCCPAECQTGSQSSLCRTYSGLLVIIPHHRKAGHLQVKQHDPAAPVNQGMGQPPKCNTRSGYPVN